MNYSELTIEKYQAIITAISMTENEVRQSMNILSIINDKPYEFYRDMKFKDFQKECKQLEWMSDAPLPDQWVKSFKCCDEVFEIVQHPTEWTAEQFISMSTLTREPINNLHSIMAVLTKGSESMNEYNRRSELFKKNLTLDVAYPTAFFFAMFLAKLSQTIPYSLHVNKKMKQAKAIGLVNNGVGIRQ